MLNGENSVPGRLVGLPDVLFVEDLAVLFRLLAVDDSTPVEGPRARHPHAAGHRQAAAL